MSRLVVVSNRVALPGGGRQAGGLTVAVNAALRKQPGIWFGWSGKVTDEAAPEPRVIESRGTTYIAMDLPRTDYEEYYQGFANSVLWPILHYRVDLAEYTNADLSGYKRVNALFADKLAAFLQPDDTIWVHDYHLMTLAHELRQRGFQNAIGFFLHIPCPPPDILLTLPQHADTLGSLAEYDLVGFQTENDTDNFCKYMETRGASLQRGSHTFEFEGRRVQADTFPVSIATTVYARAARSAANSPFTLEMRASLGQQKLMLGVDRLDYSKGIIQRMQAYDHFLEARPEWRQKVSFLQVTPKSREEVPGYKEMDDLVSGLVGQINGKFGEASWTPIRYINRSYSRKTLAGIYRSANVALVTPLRDGMNLVAKEYVAAQDTADPGVLLLSRFAGAASELDGALLVNPHETEGMAVAMRTALDMPLDERKDRHARMLARIKKYDIDVWAQQFLTRLADARQKPSLIHGLRNLLTTFTF